ncbi:hypothetical protein HanXRQr2_Chr13g0565571 [Helianthus annuus]|uniref:Uncharacterized protein n=1 Tax=Helianthus annuus TaxID=4232 RepID=A0A9K3H8E4_HELAN|nr:hypothetical protein HanXRQr2_Chr13g0565571 [Helianthus annuus]KAJ0496081.1 putative monooxygenase/2-heptyl-3-hydroxy-4(1H)-quinolone synthase [Helianthus annuus]KAJ0662141.1 putative monooxygenase/2-heptyl-3-hydroxy-4(1H)-quinolone synthase [Helianthus annuus]
MSYLATICIGASSHDSRHRSRRVCSVRRLGGASGKRFFKKASEEDDEFERIKRGLEIYGKERRWRSFSLISVAYCVGFMQESKGKLCNIKYIIIVIFNLLVI